MAKPNILHTKISTFVGVLVLIGFMALTVILVSNVGNSYDPRSKAAVSMKYQVIKQIVLSFDGSRIFTRACNANGEEPINFSGCDAWIEVTGGTPYKAGMPFNPNSTPVADIGTYTYVDQDGKQVYRKMALESGENQNLWGQVCPIGSYGPIWSQCSQWSIVNDFATWKKGLFENNKVESFSAYTFYKGDVQKVKRLMLGNVKRVSPSPTTSSVETVAYHSICSLPRFNDCEPFTRVPQDQLDRWYQETGTRLFSSFGAYYYRERGVQFVKEVLQSGDGLKQWTRVCKVDATASDSFGSCGKWTEFQLPDTLKQKLSPPAFRGWEAYQFWNPMPYSVTASTNP